MFLISRTTFPISSWKQIYTEVRSYGEYQFKKVPGFWNNERFWNYPSQSVDIICVRHETKGFLPLKNVHFKLSVSDISRTQFKKFNYHNNSFNLLNIYQ